jgi:hypothetical protein
VISRVRAYRYSRVSSPAEQACNTIHMAGLIVQSRSMRRSLKRSVDHGCGVGSWTRPGAREESRLISMLTRPKHVDVDSHHPTPHSFSTRLPLACHSRAITAATAAQPVPLAHPHSDLIRYGAKTSDANEHKSGNHPQGVDRARYRVLRVWCQQVGLRDVGQDQLSVLRRLRLWVIKLNQQYSVSTRSISFR